MNHKTDFLDVGVSTFTVHRALHDRRGVSDDPSISVREPMGYGVPGSARVSFGRRMSAYQITLGPHLVMCGNLDFSLQRKSLETDSQKTSTLPSQSADSLGYLA